MKYLIVFVFALVAGCASNLPALNSANLEFQEYERAAFFFQSSLPGVPESEETPEVKAKITALWDAGAVNCARSFVDSISPENITSIADAHVANHEYKNCTSQRGLVSTPIVTMPNGRELDFLVYLKEFETVAIRLGIENAKNQAHKSNPTTDFLTAFSLVWTGANSHSKNQKILMVSPYVTNRGTFVAPHIRTAPNQYCADNLRGCR